MHDRIKAVRKELGLNQTDFGQKIGVKQGSVAAYESGSRSPLDSVIVSICREFNVSERWLRTGEGEMFLELSRADEIAAYVGRVLKDESAFYQQKLLLFLSRLSPEMLAELEKVADEILANDKKEQKD